MNDNTNIWVYDVHVTILNIILYDSFVAVINFSTTTVFYGFVIV